MRRFLLPLALGLLGGLASAQDPGSQMPAVELQVGALRPWVRGLVTGFGAVHLVWGAHDLDAWLSSRRDRPVR